MGKLRGVIYGRSGNGNDGQWRSSLSGFPGSTERPGFTERPGSGCHSGTSWPSESTEKEEPPLASVRIVEPVVRFCAVITRHESARQWALDRLSQHWGDLAVVSAPIPFEAGGYYTPTMGSDLIKTLVALEGFLDPADLSDWKRQTNAWEEAYATESPHPEVRPLNLDPGYTTQAKLVLATTKDRDHRIYLKDGIFAEVTLTYVGKRWQHHRWSYPTYRSDEVAEFATACRQRLRAHLKATRQFRRREPDPLPPQA